MALSIQKFCGSRLMLVAVIEGPLIVWLTWTPHEAAGRGVPDAKCPTGDTI
jgi:hypothetical protein